MTDTTEETYAAGHQAGWEQGVREVLALVYATGGPRRDDARRWERELLGTETLPRDERRGRGATR